MYQLRNAGNIYSLVIIIYLFFSKCFIRAQVLQLYISFNTATILKNKRCIKDGKKRVKKK